MSLPKSRRDPKMFAEFTTSPKFDKEFRLLLGFTVGNVYSRLLLNQKLCVGLAHTFAMVYETVPSVYDNGSTHGAV